MKGMNIVDYIVEKKKKNDLFHRKAYNFSESITFDSPFRTIQKLLSKRQKQVASPAEKFRLI